MLPLILAALFIDQPQQISTQQEQVPVVEAVIVADPTLPTKLKRAPVRFKASLLGGYQVSNRASATADPGLMARIDVKGNLPIYVAEEWTPRVRIKAVFDSIPGQGLDISDPTTVQAINLDGAVLEQLAPGVEVGVTGGLSASFKDRAYGPARWGITCLLYYKEHWMQTTLGQDQRLSPILGWSETAALSIDAGTLVTKQGGIEVKVLATLIKGTRPRSDTIAQLAVSLGASKKL